MRIFVLCLLWPQEVVLKCQEQDIDKLSLGTCLGAVGALTAVGLPAPHMLVLEDVVRASESDHLPTPPNMAPIVVLGCCPRVLPAALLTLFPDLPKPCLWPVPAPRSLIVIFIS